MCVQLGAFIFRSGWWVVLAQINSRYKELTYTLASILTSRLPKILLRSNSILEIH